MPFSDPTRPLRDIVEAIGMIEDAPQSSGTTISRAGGRERGVPVKSFRRGARLFQLIFSCACVYTPDVRHLVMGDFDWDEQNRFRIARHSIVPREVEELFSADPIITLDQPVSGEDRFLAYGITAKGRLLTISFAERRNLIRPITGWDMTRQERKDYAPQILGGS